MWRHYTKIIEIKKKWFEFKALWKNYTKIININIYCFNFSFKSLYGAYSWWATESGSSLQMTRKKHALETSACSCHLPRKRHDMTWHCQLQHMITHGIHVITGWSFHWLVVSTFWNIWKSVGIIIPNIWKKQHVAKKQTRLYTFW